MPARRRRPVPRMPLRSNRSSNATFARSGPRSPAGARHQDCCEIEFAILSDVTTEDQRRFGLQTKLLFEEPLLLALPVRHEWAHREKDPEPSELKAQDLIQLSDGHCLRDQTLKACQLNQSEQGLQCDQLETALAMVSANLGMAVVPKLAIRNSMPDKVVVRSFKKPVPTRKIYLLKKKGAKLSKPADQLAGILVSDAWKS